MLAYWQVGCAIFSFYIEAWSLAAKYLLPTSSLAHLTDLLQWFCTLSLSIQRIGFENLLQARLSCRSSFICSLSSSWLTTLKSVHQPGYSIGTVISTAVLNEDWRFSIAVPTLYSVHSYENSSRVSFTTQEILSKSAWCYLRKTLFR